MSLQSGYHSWFPLNTVSDPLYHWQSVFVCEWRVAKTNQIRGSKSLLTKINHFFHLLKAVPCGSPTTKGLEKPPCMTFNVDVTLLSTKVPWSVRDMWDYSRLVSWPDARLSMKAISVIINRQIVVFWCCACVLSALMCVAALLKQICPSKYKMCQH